MDSGSSRGISSSIRRKLSILLETLRKDPNFELFIHPIDPVRDGCLDYFEVIKIPMDLITVSNKLLDDQYKNVNEIFQDIMLIFSNCREYNTSPLCAHIIDLCNKSESRFLLEWTRLGFSDKSTKKRLEELSKEVNKGSKCNFSSSSSNNNTVNGFNSNNYHSNLNQASDSNAGNASTNHNAKSNQKNNTKLQSSSSSSPSFSSFSKGNTGRVILKIDKDNISTDTNENIISNKRHKSESSKKFASNNNVIPLKKRKDSVEFLESSSFINNNSNTMTTPNKKSIDIQTFSNNNSDNNNNNNSTGNFNQNISNNSDSDWRNECLRILNALRKEHNSFLFENPVLESKDLTEETKSRYKEVIPEACDYITIEKMLNSNDNNNHTQTSSSKNNISHSKKHSSWNQKRKSSPCNSKPIPTIDNPHEFERLVKLIFSNCMIFNPSSGECKWIYDSAKHSLNKFNNLWNKSNVFLLYSNSHSNNNSNSSYSSSKQNLVEIKDSQSDTSIGFSISTTNLNKNQSQLNNNFSFSNSNNIIKNKLNINSRNMISSFNKIITQWNNYSIIWRQFILNKSNINSNSSTNSTDNTITDTKTDTGTNGTSIRRSSRSNNKNNSTCKISFKICLPSIKNNNNKNIQGLFDSNTNDSDLLDSSNNSNSPISNTIIKSNNQFELTPYSDNIEYIFPLKIYSFNMIKSNRNIINNLNRNNHNIITKLINNSKIYIYCFKPYHSHFPELDIQKNINSISNQYYFAYTNDDELINKYIELKIKIPKSISNFIIPIVKQCYIDNNVSTLNVNIIINNIVENDLNSILKIYFGNIL
ncbi:bromo domain containing [Cryptosporidium sp. chipmunk genotype I]|uniref:bromo domain containing n=1 Tax=Cryptosporidium sp. chipmunk genotype I TaxID=1280935 RepID=UPI00351A77BC|nr:bromo domain containing [Cryptosporidium sp. chipmunk genotype I]